MLDPWIIEEILREEEQRKKDAGVQIELPLEKPQAPKDNAVRQSDTNEDRGVVIIDI